MWVEVARLSGRSPENLIQGWFSQGTQKGRNLSSGFIQEFKNIEVDYGFLQDTNAGPGLLGRDLDNSRQEKQLRDTNSGSSSFLRLATSTRDKKSDNLRTTYGCQERKNG